MKKLIFALTIMFLFVSSSLSQNKFFSKTGEIGTSGTAGTPQFMLDVKLNGLFKDAILSFQTPNPEYIDSIIVASSVDTASFTPETGNDQWVKYSQSLIYDMYSNQYINIIPGSILDNNNLFSKSYKVIDDCIIRLLVIVYSSNSATLRYSLKASRVE